MKQIPRMVFHDGKDEETPLSHPISPPDLPLLVHPPQSIKSLQKMDNHYREFQHALHMLKTSVEELWRLELEQLQDHGPTPVSISNIKFDFQVPSIYNCRAVLPTASEAVHFENKDMPDIHSPMSSPATPVANILSNKMNTQENDLPSNSQTTSSKWKSLRLSNKKRREYQSTKKFTKYLRKTALLHLKFRCLKPVH